MNQIANRYFAGRHVGRAENLISRQASGDMAVAVDHAFMLQDLATITILSFSASSGSITVVSLCDC